MRMELIGHSFSFLRRFGLPKSSRISKARWTRSSILLRVNCRRFWNRICRCCVVKPTTGSESSDKSWSDRGLCSRICHLWHDDTFYHATWDCYRHSCTIRLADTSPARNAGCDTSPSTIPRPTSCTPNDSGRPDTSSAFPPTSPSVPVGAETETM